MPRATPRGMGSPPAPSPPAPSPPAGSPSTPSSPAPLSPPAPVLAFSEVGKRYPDGGREIVLLNQISFELKAGASIGIHGARHSGKSTLLRLAAAIESPDAGTITIAGRDVTRISPSEHAALLRGTLALLTAADWTADAGETVLDHVAMALGSKGLTPREAKRKALLTLDEVGVAALAAEEIAGSLSLGERARVMLARALVREPRLLLVDEPAPMPSLEDHDRFCATLRRVSSERGIALLIASESLGPLQGLGAQKTITAGGELLSTSEEPGTVVQGPWPAAASESA
jgi:ABC-type lipoprotein export system ATPase subunit